MVTMSQIPFISIVLISICVSLTISRVNADTSSIPPNVVMIVIDDLGWDDTFRSSDIEVPAIQELVKTGVVLENYYVQAVCSPSRATFQTGRYAMHHNIVDWIPDDAPYGLPLNETTLGQKFKEVGYTTRFVGKWHMGFYKWDYTPTFRGYDSFKGFYSGGEDYFTHVSGGAYDFRIDPSPKCGKGCSQVNTKDQGRYSTHVFAEEAVSIISTHDTTKPLFLMLAFQGVHSPAEVPESYENYYNDKIADPKRRKFAGMVSAVDEGIRNVTEALSNAGMIHNTLIVLTSDNGGPTTSGDGIGARNWPLRGGKHSIFEGGVRATALVSGPLLKSPGNVYNGLMHGADWFATLSDVAGYSLGGTLPLDSVSQWTSINNLSPSPRSSLVLGNSTNTCSWSVGDERRTRYERTLSLRGEDESTPECGFAIRKNNYKLIYGFGGYPYLRCNQTSTGPVCGSETSITSCPNSYCLFDVVNDPTENYEMSKEHPTVLSDLKNDLHNILKSYSQYEADKTCRSHTKGKDPVVGDVWEPWC